MPLIFVIYNLLIIQVCQPSKPKKMKRKVQKFPLLYSLAQSLLENQLKVDAEEQKKKYESKCAQDFYFYLKQMQFNRSNEITKQINEEVQASYSSEKQKGREEAYMRNIIQSLSFGLTPTQVMEVFPKAMNSDVPNPLNNLQKQKGQKVKGHEFYQQMYNKLNKITE